MRQGRERETERKREEIASPLLHIILPFWADTKSQSGKRHSLNGVWLDLVSCGRVRRLFSTGDAILLD